MNVIVVLGTTKDSWNDASVPHAKTKRLSPRPGITPKWPKLSRVRQQSFNLNGNVPVNHNQHVVGISRPTLLKRGSPLKTYMEPENHTLKEERSSKKNTRLLHFLPSMDPFSGRKRGRSFCLVISWNSPGSFLHETHRKSPKTIRSKTDTLRGVRKKLASSGGELQSFLWWDFF